MTWIIVVSGNCLVPESLLNYCELVPWERIEVKYLVNVPKRMILRKFANFVYKTSKHFVQASMSKCRTEVLIIVTHALRYVLWWRLPQSNVMVVFLRIRPNTCWCPVAKNNKSWNAVMQNSCALWWSIRGSSLLKMLGITGARGNCSVIASGEKEMCKIFRPGSIKAITTWAPTVILVRH